ncbi:MAG: hypothetical protein ACLUOI_24100 [Eisenbergiella sp.]
MGAVDEMVKKCADGAAMALDCTVKLPLFLNLQIWYATTLEEEIIRQFEAFGMPTTGVKLLAVPLMWATSAGALPSSSVSCHR